MAVTQEVCTILWYLVVYVCLHCLSNSPTEPPTPRMW